MSIENFNFTDVLNPDTSKNEEDQDLLKIISNIIHKKHKSTVKFLNKISSIHDITSLYESQISELKRDLIEFLITSAVNENKLLFKLLSFYNVYDPFVLMQVYDSIKNDENHKTYLKLISLHDQLEFKYNKMLDQIKSYIYSFLVVNQLPKYVILNKNQFLDILQKQFKDQSQQSLKKILDHQNNIENLINHYIDIIKNMFSINAIPIWILTLIVLLIDETTIYQIFGNKTVNSQNVDPSNMNNQIPQ